MKKRKRFFVFFIKNKSVFLQAVILGYYAHSYKLKCRHLLNEISDLKINSYAFLM